MLTSMISQLPFYFLIYHIWNGHSWIRVTLPSHFTNTTLNPSPPVTVTKWLQGEAPPNQPPGFVAAAVSEPANSTAPDSKPHATSVRGSTLQHAVCYPVESQWAGCHCCLGESFRKKNGQDGRSRCCLLSRQGEASGDRKRWRRKKSPLFSGSWME
jgi:hypothetical protein